MTRFWAIAITAVGLAGPAQEPPRPNGVAWKLPPGTVVFVTTDANDPAIPVNAIVLTPDEFRRQLDFARRDVLTSLDRVTVPGVCRLNLRLERHGESTVGILRAEFQFRTTTAATRVALGLKGGRFREVVLDDHPAPELTPAANDAGWLIHVPEPGDHVCRAELVVPVTHRGPRAGGRVIDVGLPEAAVTSLDFLDLGPTVRAARAAGRVVSLPWPAASPSMILGAVKSLEISWTEPGETGPPVIDVDQAIEIRADERSMTVSAKLTARVLRGLVGRLTLNVPAGARVVSAGTRINPPSESKAQSWELLRDATGDDWTIEVEWTAPLPKKSSGAFSGISVGGAARHRGTVTLLSPANWRAVVALKSDAIRREADEFGPYRPIFDSERRDLFRFQAGHPVGPLLEFELQPIRGELEVQTAHQLALTSRGWKIQSRFDFKPVRAEVARVEWELPPEWTEVRIGPPDVVESFTISETGRDNRTAAVRLTEGRRKPFTLTFDGVAPLGRNANSVGLALPVALHAIDRGGTIGLSGPEGQAITGVARPARAATTGERPTLIEWPGRTTALATASSPARLDLVWRSVTAAANLTRITADVELLDDRLVVRQTIDFGRNRPNRAILLRGADAIPDRPRTSDGLPLTPIGPGEWLTAAPPADDGTVRLVCSVPHRAGAPVLVPVLWPTSGSTSAVARVSFGQTADGLFMPRALTDKWPSKPVSPPEGLSAWPALELEATTPEVPLVLSFDPLPGDALPPLVIESVYARGWIDDEAA